MRIPGEGLNASLVYRCWRGRRGQTHIGCFICGVAGRILELQECVKSMNEQLKGRSHFAEFVDMKVSHQGVTYPGPRIRPGLQDSGMKRPSLQGGGTLRSSQPRKAAYTVRLLPASFLPSSSGSSWSTSWRRSAPRRAS